MYAYFPINWRFGDSPEDGLGGPAPEDPGTLYVCREKDAEEDYPDGDFDAPSLVFQTSLNEIVSDTLAGWEGPDRLTHDDHLPASDALAAALRVSADRLDAANPRALEKRARETSPS